MLKKVKNKTVGETEFAKTIIVSVIVVNYNGKKFLKDFLEYKGFKILSFESDVINSPFGLFFRLLANFFSTLERGLIIKCQKI